MLVLRRCYSQLGRSKIARRKIKQMVRGVYKKCWDESSKNILLLQYKTNQAHWTKPLCLGDDDLELTPRTMLAAHVKPPKKTPRFTAKDLTPEEAAKHLQGCWRNKVARRKIRLWYVTFTKNVGTIQSRCFTTSTRGPRKAIGRSLYAWDLRILRLQHAPGKVRLCFSATDTKSSSCRPRR